MWRHERIMSFIPPQKVIPRARRRSKAPIEDYNHIRQARITKNSLIKEGWFRLEVMANSMAYARIGNCGVLSKAV